MAQSAPGKHYREGISLVELFQRFPNDEAAERWFEVARWGETGKPDHCPMCGSTDKLKIISSRKPLPYRCGECRRYFSVRTGTVMHRSKIGLQKWAIATYLWSVSLKGVSSMRLHRDLKITQKSAYFMAQRLREAWSEDHGGMAGPVEVDEAREVLLQITGKGGTGENKSSLCNDLLSCRRTEIDFINGAIVRLGAEHGVPTPVNSTLIAAVKALESHYLA